MYRFALSPSLLFISLAIFPHATKAQTAGAAAEVSTASEVSTNDEPATFQSGVNLVAVPVVVRDSRGTVVSGLKKEDFQLFDRGKLQVIAKFTIEKPGIPPIVHKEDKELEKTAGESTPEAGGPIIGADHFTAYVFDDVHLNFTDLAQVRDAAVKHLETALLPTDRAAIFTTSGQTTLDFTDNHLNLRETLLRLRPHPSSGGVGIAECPDISFYMADAMENKHDSIAIQVAVAETQSCLSLPNSSGAQQIAESTARRVLESGDYETRQALRTLEAVIQRMSVLPGQRSILLASPGFFVPDTTRSSESGVMDKAVKASVIVSALDARGLYTIDPLGDISQPTVSVTGASRKAQYITQSALNNADVLAELANGTGGAFFQNSNDLLAGFKKLSATPETIYFLWFSPENLKLDGSFHHLKVTLVEQKKLELQARRGYFAPKHLATAEDSAKEQIRDLIFSREELANPGVDLQTQFFKVSDTDSNLSVVTHVALKQLNYRKLDGRNSNELTVVSALFDRNGNFIKALEKIVTLHLRDQTLEKTPRITVKSEFEVPPGAYVVRLVVRDMDGKMMVAENGSVEIPY